MSRKTIATIAALVGTEFAVLGLRQFGVIKKLPDLPWKPFDANGVMRSRVAYPFGIPDSVFATAGCATMVGLATVKRSRWIDRLLAAAATIGAAGAVFYLGHMTIVQKKICIYCVAAATGLFAIVPLAYREATR